MSRVQEINTSFPPGAVLQERLLKQLYFVNGPVTRFDSSLPEQNHCQFCPSAEQSKAQIETEWKLSRGSERRPPKV